MVWDAAGPAIRCAGNQKSQQVENGKVYMSERYVERHSMHMTHLTCCVLLLHNLLCRGSCCLAKECAESLGQLTASADRRAEVGGPNIEQCEREWLHKVSLEQRQRGLHHCLRLLFWCLHPLSKQKNSCSGIPCKFTVVLQKCGIQKHLARLSKVRPRAHLDRHWD
jgi:hypothetical protein